MTTRPTWDDRALIVRILNEGNFSYTSAHSTEEYNGWIADELVEHLGNRPTWDAQFLDDLGVVLRHIAQPELQQGRQRVLNAVDRLGDWAIKAAYWQEKQGHQ